MTPIIERRDVCWRGVTWRDRGERISSTRFRLDRWPEAEPETADEVTIDGVAVRSLTFIDDDQIEVELVAPLPLIEFVPHREFPRRPGDIAYADALVQASGEYPVDASAIRETASYWVFPVFQIGCCGVAVDKATGKLTGFGSSYPIDEWIWGYERGLLDEPPRDLIITSIRDFTATHATLQDFLQSFTIDALPDTFVGCAVWTAIPHLRAAGDAFAWHCEPASITDS